MQRGLKDAQWSTAVARHGRRLADARALWLTARRDAPSKLVPRVDSVTRSGRMRCGHCCRSGGTPEQGEPAVRHAVDPPEVATDAQPSPDRLDDQHAPGAASARVPRDRKSVV